MESAEQFNVNSSKIEVLKEKDMEANAESLCKIEDLRDHQQEKLAKNGINDLFPVQKACYNLFVEGREIIVKSRTGTGKTLAFLLPIEELIARDLESGTPDGDVTALILEPTRELAN